MERRYFYQESKLNVFWFEDDVDLHSDRIARERRAGWDCVAEFVGVSQYSFVVGKPLCEVEVKR